MPPSVDCPGNECWQALFGDTVPPEQQELYERHLESCPACQERLDRSLEDTDEVLHLVRQFGAPQARRTDAALAQVLDRLHEVKSPVRTAPGEPGDRYFLQPADRPGVLGTLGNYEVREVIGRGGMGIVFQGFDRALHRLVAIKVLAPTLAGSSTARRRFTREAQAVAAISHEHVVAVHGVCDNDGLPYLVMQYVAGESLQARLDRTGPLEVTEVVRIGHQTASGLAAAHAQGLIHRDVKPANLLLEDGLAKVKITDFGLARLADDVGLTQSGVVAGTPEYMAPEQARGEPVDHRADLFSLGSVLYALCTGHPPFRGSSAVAVLRQVSDQVPTPIRSLNPEVHAWLETFIARLLVKDPAGRFRSAAEVAGLLEGYLAHLRQPTTIPAPDLPPPPGANCPGEAAPRSGVGAPRRRRLWLPALVLLGALGLAAPLLVLGIHSGGSVPDQTAVPAAGAEPGRTTGSKSGLVTAELLGLLLTLALLGGWLYARYRRAGKRERPSVWRRVWAPGAVALLALVSGWLLWPRRPAQLPAPEDAPFMNVTLGAEPVPDVEESGFSYQEYDKDQQPFRWTDGNGRLEIPINRKNPPPALLVQLRAFRGPQVKEARFEVVANGQRLFDDHIPLGRWEKTFDLKGVNLGDRLVLELRSDTFSPMGNARGDGKGASDDARTLGVQVKGIRLLAPVAGARDLAAEKSIDIWQGLPQGIACGVLAADGKTLVSGSRDGTVKVWDATASQERVTLLGLAPGLQALAVSPDGTSFATAGSDRVVRVWDTATGQGRAELRGHTGDLTALAYAPDGKTLASTAGNRLQRGELKLWDLATGAERVPGEPFTRRLWGVAFAPDGKRVAVADGNGKVQVVDAGSGQVTATFSHPAYAHGVAFAPDGKRLAVTYGDEGLVRIYELDGGTLWSPFQAPHGNYVGRPEYSGDGRRLVLPCLDGTALVWDVSGPQARVVCTLGGHEGPVRFAAFFPDGRTVATADERTIRLWNIGDTGPAPATPEAAAPATGRGPGLVLACGLALVLALALGVGLMVRRRRAGALPAPAPPTAPPTAAAAAPASVRFPCPGCGKQLKARADRAGKEFPCPQCRKVVRVPGTGANESIRPSP